VQRTADQRQILASTPQRLPRERRKGARFQRRAPIAEAQVVPFRQFVWWSARDAARIKRPAAPVNASESTHRTVGVLMRSADQSVRLAVVPDNAPLAAVLA
jgi:hypothetical protein